MTVRSYTVKVVRTLNDEVHVTQGTAQGFVLGPLHFITYVNDLENVMCSFRFAMALNRVLHGG